MKKRVKRHAVVQPLDQSIKLIPLTQGQNAIVDAAYFEWLSQWNWFASWSPIVKNFYAARQTDQEHTVFMHRVILGCGEKEQCDHRNHDTLDNRKINLRQCTPCQNSSNRKINRSNTSGYKGVSKHRNKWIAIIRFNWKRKHLGSFTSAEDAARAYDTAAKLYHGEFAHLNFP